MMAKKEQTAWAPSVASGCLFPVVRLPVIWLTTSAKMAQNKLPMVFGFLVRCVQGIFHLKRRYFIITLE